MSMCIVSIVSTSKQSVCLRARCSPPRPGRWFVRKEVMKTHTDAHIWDLCMRAQVIQKELWVNQWKRREKGGPGSSSNPEKDDVKSETQQVDSRCYIFSSTTFPVGDWEFVRPPSGQEP